MIDPVCIAYESLADACKVDEAVPVGVVTGKARYLEAEHETDTAERDFGDEAGKPRSNDRAGPGEAEVLVDDYDSLVGPAKLAGLDCQGVLAVRRFPVMFYLIGTGLPQVHNGKASEMTCRNFIIVSHCLFALPIRQRPFGRSNVLGFRAQSLARLRRVGPTVLLPECFPVSCSAGRSSNARVNCITKLLWQSRLTEFDASKLRRLR